MLGLELYFDPRGEFAVDNLEDLLRRYPKYAERAIISALKSQGYRLKGILQESVRRGGPAGYNWPQLNPHTGVLSRRMRKGQFVTVKNTRMVWKGEKGKKKRIKEYKQTMLSTRLSPLLKFAGGIRYRFEPELMLVRIGFVNPAVDFERIVRMQQRGFFTTVTPKMRRMFFAMGFPLKKETTQLRTPSRKLIEPVFEAERRGMMDNLKKGYLANVKRYAAERR